MRLSSFGWLAMGVMVGTTAEMASGASLVSSRAYCEVIFTAVREIPSGQASGRNGLSFQYAVDAYGFSGGSAADADSDINIDIGYIGAFPDGKAPVPGSGLKLTFNPYASATEMGDAFGIGALWLRNTFTDKTGGNSRWEIECQISTWVKCDVVPMNGEINLSFWRALAGFDVTDSEKSFEQWVVTDEGFMPTTTARKDGPTQFVKIVIDGNPGEDPAIAVLNLRTEAEATVRHNAISHGPVFSYMYWSREGDLQTYK
jgi:hypothetical protein